MSASDNFSTAYVELEARHLRGTRPSFMRNPLDFPVDSINNFSYSGEFKFIATLVRENDTYCEVNITDHDIAREIYNKNVIVNGMEQIYANAKYANEFFLKVRKSACIIRRPMSEREREYIHRKPDVPEICFRIEDRRRLVQLL